MPTPAVWHALAGGFVLAGLMNAGRWLRDRSGRRDARGWLALSCAGWAAAAELLRVAASTAAIACAAAACLLMLAAAVASTRPAPGSH